MRPSKFTPKKKARAIKMFENGKTAMEVAEKFGTTRGNIYQWVKKKDVKPVLKKVKKEIVEKKEVKTKGSTPEPKKVIKKIVKKKKKDVEEDDDEEKLKLDFE